MSVYNRFLSEMRDTLETTDVVSPESEEMLRARQERNLSEWKKAMQMAQTDKQRDVLLKEMESGRGVDFPSTDAKGFQIMDLSGETDPKQSQAFQIMELPEPSFADDLEARQQAAPRPDMTTGTGAGAVPPLGFQESPTGAVTGIRRPRAGGDIPPDGIPSWLQRVGIETAGSAIGGGVAGLGTGLVTKNPMAATLATRAGEGAGAFLGSLVAEVFDPTENPTETALKAGGFTLGTGLVATGGGAMLRRALGNPTEAGKHILKVMEREGKVPPPGAVLDETSIAQTIQSIGSAEAFFGRHVKEAVEETGMALTRDLRHWVADFYRYKKGAAKGFKEWDNLIANNPATFGAARTVPVKSGTFDALEQAVKEWERRGLASQVDNNLLNIVKAVQQAKAQGLSISTIKMTMSEAEAARTFLYNRARSEAGTATAEKGAIAGEDFARAYRNMAQEVDGSIDDAINEAVKNGKIPAAARANLEGARSLWKQWKQGEAILDELLVPMKSAGRRTNPLKSQRIETAINNIERLEEKWGRPVISSTQKAHLAGVMRALRAAEKSGTSSAFTLAVRTGQLASLTMGVGAGVGFGGLAGGLGALTLALSPAAFTYLVTNPTAARLLISGLRMSPGADAAARVSRELISLLAKEGFTDIDQTRLNPRE